MTNSQAEAKVMTKRDLVDLAVTLGGLPVMGCLASSPAARAGVRYGDVLLAVDGVATETWDEYLRVRGRSGHVLKLRLFRDGGELDLELQLDEGPPRSLAELIADLEAVNGSGTARACTGTHG